MYCLTGVIAKLSAALFSVMRKTAWEFLLLRINLEPLHKSRGEPMSYDWHGQCKNLRGKAHCKILGLPGNKSLEER